MRAIQIYCPGCGATLNARPDQAGRAVGCPRCGARMVVPAPPDLDGDGPSVFVAVDPDDAVGMARPARGGFPWWVAVPAAVALLGLLAVAWPAIGRLAEGSARGLDGLGRGLGGAWAGLARMLPGLALLAAPVLPIVASRLGALSPARWAAMAGAALVAAGIGLFFSWVGFNLDPAEFRPSMRGAFGAGGAFVFLAGLFLTFGCLVAAAVCPIRSSRSAR